MPPTPELDRWQLALTELRTVPETESAPLQRSRIWARAADLAALGLAAGRYGRPELAARAVMATGYSRERVYAVLAALDLPDRRLDARDPSAASIMRALYRRSKSATEGPA